MDPIALLVAALATARLTRLVTTDRITNAPRNWVLRKLRSDSKLAYLIVCDWCASFYIGAVLAAAGAWYGSWPWLWVLPVALGFSYISGWMALREGEV